MNLWVSAKVYLLGGGGRKEKKWGRVQNTAVDCSLPIMVQKMYLMAGKLFVLETKKN